MTSYKSNDTRDPIMGQYIVGLSCPDAFDKASLNDLMANGNDVLNSKELNSNYNLSNVHRGLETPRPSSSKVHLGFQAQRPSFSNVHLDLETPRPRSSKVTIHLAPCTSRFNYVIDKLNSIMAKSDRNPGKQNQYKTVCINELNKKFYTNRTFVHYPFSAGFDKASLKHNGMHLQEFALYSKYNRNEKCRKVLTDTNN